MIEVKDMRLNIVCALNQVADDAPIFGNLVGDAEGAIEI